MKTYFSSQVSCALCFHFPFLCTPHLHPLVLTPSNFQLKWHCGLKKKKKETLRWLNGRDWRWYILILLSPWGLPAILKLSSDSRILLKIFNSGLFFSWETIINSVGKSNACWHIKINFLSLKSSNMLTIPFPGDSFALGVRGLGGAGKRTKREN